MSRRSPRRHSVHTKNPRYHISQYERGQVGLFNDEEFTEAWSSPEGNIYKEDYGYCVSIGSVEDWISKSQVDLAKKTLPSNVILTRKLKLKEDLDADLKRLIINGKLTINSGELCAVLPTRTSAEYFLKQYNKALGL